jgi:hypothetical protein
MVTTGVHIHLFPGFEACGRALEFLFFSLSFNSTRSRSAIKFHQKKAAARARLIPLSYHHDLATPLLILDDARPFRSRLFFFFPFTVLYYTCKLA